jgi:hypothetical protein
LCRDFFQDSDGGHFFLASYGIRVMSAPDTLIVWQPQHYHGTSLQRLDPYAIDPNMVQRGMSSDVPAWLGLKAVALARLLEALAS